MKTAATSYCFNEVVLAALLFILPAALLGQANSSTNLDRVTKIAASQHEIVMILIKKKDFDQAAKEACKIFEMQWPDSQEKLLLKELIILSDQFLNNSQAPIALHLIDSNAKSFKQLSSRIDLLKEKAFLYKNLNQDDKALEYFRKAQELEQGRNKD
jgi:hypothetical protein